MTEQELTSPIQFYGYTPNCLVIDDGKNLLAVSELFSTATVLTLKETYGSVVGVYADSDGMVKLLIKSPYIDITEIASELDAGE